MEDVRGRQRPRRHFTQRQLAVFPLETWIVQLPSIWLGPVISAPSVQLLAVNVPRTEVRPQPLSPEHEVIVTVLPFPLTVPLVMMLPGSKSRQVAWPTAGELKVFTRLESMYQPVLGCCESVVSYRTTLA